MDRIAISLSVSRQAAWERCHEVDGPAGDKSVTDHAFPQARRRPGTGTGTATGHLAARYQRRTKPRPARANIRLTGLKAPSVHRLNRVEQVDPHHDQGHYAGPRDGVGFC